MRVRNISNKPTAELKSRGLLNATVALGGNLLAPGEVADVSDVERGSATFQRLVTVGVLVEDNTPVVKAKEVAFTPPPKGKSPSEDKVVKEKE